MSRGRLCRWAIGIAIAVGVLPLSAVAQSSCLNSPADINNSLGVCINDVQVTYPQVPSGQPPNITINVHFMDVNTDDPQDNEPDFFNVRFSETTAWAGGLNFVRQDKLTGQAWGHGWLITRPMILNEIGPPYLIEVQWCKNVPLSPAQCWPFTHFIYTPPGLGAAPSSTQPASAKLPPPGTCKQGFVWRQVDPRDHVCVTAQTRKQVLDDNAAAPQHTIARGAVHLATPQDCLAGYVWRQAVASDYVCVTPQTRSATQADNAAAAMRTY